MEWRIIPSFDSYEVSEYGHVRRCKERLCGGGIGKVMKPYKREDGYDMYILRKDLKSFHRKAHQLVAEAFISAKPFERAEVCHNDGTRTNNHYTNLRWGSSSDNKKDMIAHGRDRKGEKHYNSKLKSDDVKEIKKMYSLGFLQREIAEKFGIKQSQVSRILLGKRWSHV